jgi:hypothetical protein
VLRLNDGPALRVPLGGGENGGEELSGRLEALGIPALRAGSPPTGAPPAEPA